MCRNTVCEMCYALDLNPEMCYAPNSDPRMCHALDPKMCYETKLTDLNLLVCTTISTNNVCN